MAGLRSLLLLTCCVFPLEIDGLLTVTDPQRNLTTTHTTSTFKYLGNLAENKNASSLNEVPTVYLEASDICFPDPLLVQGKIVFSDRTDAPCHAGDIYLALDDAGAQAFVFLHIYRPGYLCNIHYNWDPAKYSQRRMMMVAVGIDDIGDLPHWKSTSMKRMRASILSPHNRDYQRLFRSLLWTIFMRVVLPVFAFHTALLALFEIGRVHQIMRVRKNRRNNIHASTPLESVRVIHLIIVWLEAPSMIIIGLEMIFGAFGPLMLPYSLHFALYFQFNGLSVATTVLLAILMREETRAARCLPRRHILGHYRFTVVLLFVLFLGSDITWMSAAFYKELRYFSSPLGVTFVFGATLLIQGGAGIYFFVRARSLRSHLVELVENPMMTANATKIFRLLTWLNIVGIACLLATLALCAKFLALLKALRSLLGTFHATAYFLSHFFSTLGRIMVSYSQVRQMIHGFSPFSRVSCLIFNTSRPFVSFQFFAHRYNP
mmetsp:Transcript_54744/g.124673  ORF Transcript_54744/g.124673 Transcript_54744/m.124673 type:complete len:489 (+) Transcript_54744:250-1716(+)